MNTFEAVRVVAAREVRVKLRDKAFLFSTVFFLLFAVGATVVPAMFGDDASKVAVSGTAPAALGAAGLDVRSVADDAAARALVRDGEVDGALLADGTVVALTDAPGDLVNALSTRPTVELLDPSAVDDTLAILVPMVFAMIFFFVSLTFGLQIAQSVTEEKQTRVVEILVASVPVRVLLAGKVLAGAALAMGQIALIAVVALAGMRFSDSGGGLLTLLGPAIGWFLPFFLVGFVMLAALWAAVGALVNRQEDINGASMPMQILVLLPFFGVVMFNSDPVVMKVLSYVPFSAPAAMPVRLFQGDAAGWEPALALLILAVSAVAVLFAGARIYEGSLLRSNGRTSIAAAWRDREARRLVELDAESA
ncbi:ABC transporter permease [Catellatospora citrea]|uniref:ABC transporter permease n=1 Tax=Catellatospora citrea TaxID=53366 RepID=A0A8J3NZA2_9ACTN|nr:ABC transporter permease [Catellatospora citrea]RKE12609.1 ABC-2 type transport system permease protein [Catellatospora citrea]GIF96155.1 ABC transporter permease [Catellatospora citrea]